MLWINFLHWYQPANSDAYKIKEAAEMSYKRIVDGLEKNKNIKFTINISGCLVLRLAELNYFDLLDKINFLIKKGQVELVSTAAYHALLPLIKEEEAILQIKENEKIIKKYFPKAKLRGFFLPEMAYSSKVAKIIKKLGYSWIILDEISSVKQNLDLSRIYLDKNSGLKIIFRSRFFSNCYVPDKLNEIINKEELNYKIIISATDGELYGLRHHDPTKKLEKILSQKKIETVLISDYVKKFRNIEETLIRDSNWESSEQELKNKQPYHLWYNKKNIIHVKLWKLADITLYKINKYNKDPNFDWARWHFVRGLASCTFWWASAQDFKHNFGPHAWSPDEIERGANEFIRAIRSLENSTSRLEKIKAEELFISIKKLVWTKHWTYHANNNYE